MLQLKPYVVLTPPWKLWPLMLYAQPSYDPMNDLYFLYIMVWHLQSGLQEPINQFYDIQKVKEDGRITYKDPNPRVEYQYTYLMA